MAYLTTYETSKPLNPKHGEIKRYVRCNAMNDGYSWCEKQVGSGYDLSQGTCDASDIPEKIREEADKMRGFVYGWIVWPR